MAGIFTLGVCLAACGEESRITAESGWVIETATKQYACGMRFWPDKTFRHNCNGTGFSNGKWEINGSSLRIILNNGQVSSCAYSFDGTILVLGVDNCAFRGRYETWDDWHARMKS